MKLDRYQIAIGKAVKPVAYRFKPTVSSIRVCEYMKQCINDEVMFESGNISGAILDSAVVMLSKEIKVPVLTGSERTARLLSITHDYKNIFSMDKLPKRYNWVICYWDMEIGGLPKGLKSLLSIRKSEE